MDAPFKKIALAVTFSPTRLALLREAARLKELFNAELLLIHVARETAETKNKLEEMVKEAGIDPGTVRFEWGTGDPVKVIASKCIGNKVDLLIAGALEKEAILTYYTGSIARKLMREAPCSMLILVSPQDKVKMYTKMCVSVSFESECAAIIKKAFQFAHFGKTKEISLLREFQVPGLSITVYDGGSTEETEESRSRWVKEEEDKLRIFLSEHNLVSDIALKLVALYGKSGWESKNFVQQAKSDLLVIASPAKKLNFFDRLFQHDLEFIFENLPCSLLMIKQ